MNYVELIELQAVQVFADKAKADAWLNKPQTALGGSAPLDLAHSETGYLLVRDALERINHGYAF